jgi:hypothetical protein
VFDLAVRPFDLDAGVLVARGGQVATTTVFLQLPMVNGAVAGQPSATWVGVSDGGVSRVLEFKVYPATGPAGAMWLEESACTMDSSMLDIGAAVDLGSGVSADPTASCWRDRCPREEATGAWVHMSSCGRVLPLWGYC